jgi:aminoglycoside 3-N-acetyltransferase
MGEHRQDWRAQPVVDAAALAADLRRLGLVPGAVVLVHSSLSRLGHVRGGAEAAVDALLDGLGPRGTLLFPTLTGSAADGPGAPPAIDIRRTPCWTGYIPETARRRAGARRSMHPTHSVAALGAQAEQYTAGHERSATPCDEHSPYFRLINDSGYILLLGATHESNTTLHCLEELAGVPYHLQPQITTCSVVDAAGVRHTVRNRLHLWRWDRDFARVDAPLRQAGAILSGRVGQARAHLIPAWQLADLLLPILRDDPLYLLSPEARAAFVAETGGTH